MKVYWERNKILEAVATCHGMDVVRLRSRDLPASLALGRNTAISLYYRKSQSIVSSYSFIVEAIKHDI